MKTGIYSSVAIFVIASFLAGCDGEHHNQSAVTEHVGHDLHDHQMASPVANDDGLVLNGVAKWNTDNHTREMVAKMNTRLSQKALADYSVEELKAIGSGLRKDIDELITGCTMEGDAHNELHKFLMALTAAVDSLASSGDLVSAEKVRDLLGNYQGFFE